MKPINIVCHAIQVLLLFCCIRSAFSQNLLSFAWSGGVTDSRAVVVVKTKPTPSTGGVIVVSSNADLSSPVYTSANTLADANNIIRFEGIVGLIPNTSYYYGVEIDGVLDDVLNDADNGLEPYTGAFKTMPAPGSAASYNFVFSSCLKTSPLGNAVVFDTIKSKGPIFWMSIGDFHYGDITVNDPAAFRSQFDKRLVSGGTGTKLASLSRALPFVYMWDDHDFGPNDSHGAGVTNSYKQAAHKVFREYIPYHDLNLAGDAAYTLGEEPIAQAFTVGRIRYILTDLRSESTRNIGAGETKLGATQKAWFKEELLKANGTYPVIIWVTSMPWNGSSLSGGSLKKDRWQYFIDEREEIANFLNDNHITGFCALSGDMHGMAIDDGTNTNFTTSVSGPGFPLFHASPLNNKDGSYKAGPYSKGQAKGTIGGTMFGMVDFTDNGDTVTVQMTAKDQDDATVIATIDEFGNPIDNIGNPIAYSFSQSNPLLVSLNPADDSSGVSVTADLEVSFSEKIMAGTTGNVQLYNAADDSIIEAIAITSPAISILNNSLSINPATDLPSNTSIYVSIDQGAVLDASSNAFAGISVPAGVAYKKWNFTTASIITAITATESNGTYNIGDTINITIQFDDIVTVTGIPQLTLETGTTDVVVDYTSGSGTDTLTFTYTVASEHTSTDLDYVSTTALSLNGGTIQDADLTLPTPGTAGSLGTNKDLIIDTTLPNDPTNLTTNPVSRTQINLSWSDNSTNETGFKIERAGNLIITTAADATSYSDSSLSCGTTYNYSIFATNANGDSTAVTASATTLACSTPVPAPTPVPNAPTDLSGSAASQTQINLSWTDNSTNETGFKIERAGTLITTTAANATNYSDSGLSCGTTYNYSIKATNANGDSSATTANASTLVCSTGYLQPEPSSHDFGQLENNQQAHQLFTITNTSDETVIHINTVILTGNKATEFTQSTDVEHQCTDKTLEPSEVCSEYISLLPNSIGEKQAQLLVSSDDPVIPKFNIGLSAFVVDPDVVQTDIACLAEIPTLQTIDSGLWGDDVWGDMDGNPVSDLPGENDILLINQKHTIICLPKIEMSALCNRGELRSAVGESLEIIASNGISNYGKIIGEPGLVDPETNCGTPGSDVILKSGTSFYKSGGWRWYGEGKPIYNNAMIRAGDGGDSEDCGGKGGNAIVLGRHTTNDYSGVIFAGEGGNASVGTGGRGGLAQVWGKLGGSGNLVSRGQVYAGDGGNGGSQGGDGGWLWLVSWPNVYLGFDRTFTDFGAHGTTEISAHHAGDGGTPNGEDGTVKIEPPLIALTQGVEIKGGDINIFGGDDMTLDFSGLTETAITATGDIILSVGRNGVINFEGTTATIFKAAGNVIIRADHILTDKSVGDDLIEFLETIIEANEIILEPGQVQREVLLTGPSVLIGEPNTTTTLTFILTNNGPTADEYNLKINDTAGWDLGDTFPDSVSLDGLSSVEFDVHVTPPADLGEGDLISAVATSQTDGETVMSVADVQIITGIREVVEPEPPIDDKTPETIEPLIDDETPKPVEPPINDGIPETQKPVEPTIGDGNDNKSPSIPTTPTTHSTVQPAGCLFVGEVFNEVCNAGGRNITHLKTVKGSNLSNAVIKGTLTNNGWVSNLTITKEGHLIGGNVTGYIVNDGLMEDFEFRGMSIIGGTLGGIVTNRSQVGGYIKDVHLAPNTHLTGGELRGKIRGDKKAPALIEGAKINRNAVLSNLIIGEGTELAKGVTIGKGVRFANGTLIPEGLYLTDALSNDDGTIDLNSDIVTGGASLLQQINQLSEMLENGWQLAQDAETGEYYVMVRDIRIVVIPLRVRQARRGSGVKLKIHPNGVHVTLVTAQEREILVEIQVDTSP